jgi:hypothetical protein
MQQGVAAAIKKFNIFQIHLPTPRQAMGNLLALAVQIS